MIFDGFLLGLFRRFRSLVLRREVEVVGRCRLCGNCCRNILLRNGYRWLRTEKQYRQLVTEAPEHARFKVMEESVDGCLVFTCSRLDEDDRCTCHETRPDLCRNYPSKSLYYRGGYLRDDCGYAYRETTFRDVLTGRKRLRPKPFSDVLDRELEQEQDKDR